LEASKKGETRSDKTVTREPDMFRLRVKHGNTSQSIAATVWVKHIPLHKILFSIINIQAQNQILIQVYIQVNNKINIINVIKKPMVTSK